MPALLDVACSQAVEEELALRREACFPGRNNHDESS